MAMQASYSPPDINTASNVRMGPPRQRINAPYSDMSAPHTPHIPPVNMQYPLPFEIVSTAVPIESRPPNPFPLDARQQAPIRRSHRSGGSQYQGHHGNSHHQSVNRYTPPTDSFATLAPRMMNTPAPLHPMQILVSVCVAPTC